MEENKSMEIIADLHPHSKYARAVSSQMEVPEIARWAAIKGISLVGTGDWTHPLWLNELKSQLEEVEEGVFRLARGAWQMAVGQGATSHKASPQDERAISNVRFLLTTEISSIYTQGGRQRRIHNLVFAPNFSIVERINNELLAKGCNLSSDGRPIVGLSSRELAGLVFSISEECLIIPAHVWTPWFSLFGANSGFDSLKECFGEFSGEIYAIETGLSSNPAMNWRIKELDDKTIVSFSDAHSPKNLGREATVFEVKDTRILRYKDIKEAIKQSTVNSYSKQLPRIAYTIEFFPEEGKYHYTGHRNCGVCYSPEETAKLGAICPVCGRKLTVGVMQRVEDLATREKLEVRSERLEGEVRSWSPTRHSRFGDGARLEKSNRPPYVMLVPLLEIIAESLGLGKGTRGVEEKYFGLVNQFGSEFKVLLETPIEEIQRVGGEKIGNGIQKVRDGDLYIKPGFDGVFGEVKIWSSSAKASEGKEKQLALF